MLKRGMRPAHPGAILNGMIEGLREETNETFTITEIAEGLGVNRKTLSQILHMKSGISPEMAIKLSEAFGTSAELWMNLQKKYDLWHAEKKVSRETIRHFINADVKGLQSA
ncbi:HigA family addiction module antitoxin [Dyadobacter sp. LHD-138]|uniref:HigA family addiction module antitoxin n=1 Tax=Dyadobacter sp. LHD-138 TaxID=3071413 RepID=UPI0027E002D8|nr:HigA family addiction module antitoxin [Dyadobacter sp. LHD-138]MDQ6478273.1 HigA family addiction module antitoxin [Dyadobacter sp. LHD-138]